MNLWRVRIALTAWYVAVLLLIVSATGLASYVALKSALSNEVDRSLESSAERLAAQLRERPEPSPETGIERTNGRDGQRGDDEDEHEEYELRYLTGASGDVFYAILSPDGTPLQNPLNVDLSLLNIGGALDEARNDGEAWRTLDTEDGHYRLLLYAVRKDGNVSAFIETGRSLEGHERDLNNLANVLVVASAGGLALALAGGFVVAGRALRPASQAFDKQREFIADASHELRTPLTLIRASAEAIRRGRQSRLSAADQEALADILAESDRMSVLVEDLLTLAKLDENRLPLRLEHLDMAPLLREAGRWAQGLANGRRIAIAVEAASGLDVRADREAITRVVRIILDNALRYAGEGGNVAIRAVREGVAITVSIQDSGPGLQPSELAHVFERFYRADQARSQATGGSGLGLAIAKGIVEAHGGRIRAESTPGHGASFRFTLPAVQG